MSLELASPDGRHRVIFHTAARMKEIPTGTVNLTVTSPPYMLGLNYTGYDKRLEHILSFAQYEGVVKAKSKHQLERPTLSYDDYENNMRSMEPVWEECWRVTVPGGFIAINGVMGHGATRFFGQQVMLPMAEDIALWWRKRGAIYKAHIIWEAIRGANNSKGEHASFMGSFQLPLEGCIIRDTERILIFRKPTPEGWVEPKEREKRRRQSRISKEDWYEWFTEIWRFKGAPKAKAGEVTHPAPYPEELAHRLICMYSVKDDLVLDPFNGTGTTTLQAKRDGRRSIGYEVEERFADIVEGRCHLGAATGSEDEF